ncbi:urease accessory protein UreD [Hydrogenophaga sp.]|uniref:urease accessory protein UreD n=1 Tax=Hydrogenophaga sp. TaxID=1904254 RepID=UPI00272FAD9D|nr:urease accessory protein UreD [Hydrogenophaga sp.]MDP2016848.1 urease accessory protein UreD [Hydrogenophaga sp.]MDP3167399.1 urease accessory protein UreD [Hydrogenophaga sp.]
MPWHARLSLDLRFEHQKTTARFEHDGPLRILKSLYPEGHGICHNVIIHPPGGLVGGDVLDVRVQAGAGTHGLISTPGATRFYRSDGPATTQQVTLALLEGARLEWLPLEAIAYPGCLAHNSLSATLAEGAEMIGWDVCALGLPSANQPFDRGSLTQHLEIPGLWLERSRIDATDTRLLESPLGLGGHKCMGTLWLACGTPITRERREHLLEVVRAVLGEQHGAEVGATCPNPRMLVVRAVAPLVEPLMALLQQIWATLRTHAWQLDNTPPRIWKV